MDEETALTRIMERICRLENEVRELRQLIFVQMPHLVNPIDKSSSIPANSDLPEPEAGTDCLLKYPNIISCLAKWRVKWPGGYFRWGIA